MITLEQEKTMIIREISRVTKKVATLASRDELGNARELLKDLTNRHKEIEKLIDVEKKKDPSSSD